MRPAAKAAAHTAAMLDAWHQAGIARADLAVRTANAAMLWYADRPLDALPLALARAHNVKQADIYIRPARGSAWPMVLLDDVDIAMAQRVAKHYATLVVHTSAQGGCHLWLRLTRALDEAQRRQVQRWLIPKVDADPGSVSGEHLGRLAGMKNFKRAGQWVNVLQQPSPHTLGPDTGTASSPRQRRGATHPVHAGRHLRRRCLRLRARMGLGLRRARSRSVTRGRLPTSARACRPTSRTRCRALCPLYHRPRAPSYLRPALTRPLSPPWGGSVVHDPTPLRMPFTRSAAFNQPLRSREFLANASCK